MKDHVSGHAERLEAVEFGIESLSLDADDARAQAERRRRAMVSSRKSLMMRTAFGPWTTRNGGSPRNAIGAARSPLHDRYMIVT